VLVLYDRKLGAGEYRLGRILRTLPDAHGRVRTVVVGMRSRTKEKPTEYVPKKLEEHTLGIQRVAVICPIEEQGLVGGAYNGKEPGGDELVGSGDGLMLDGETIGGDNMALGDHAIRGFPDVCDVQAAADGGTVRADGDVDADQGVNSDGDAHESPQKVLAEKGE